MSDDHNPTGNTDAELMATLSRFLPRVAPPDDLFGRILAEILPEATVVPLHRRIRRRAVPALGAIVAAAAVVIIALVMTGRNGSPPIEGRAAIAGKSIPSVTGQAVLYGSNKDGGTVRISLRDVPPAPSGHHYEVWVLRKANGASMEAVGAFTPVSSNVNLDLSLPGPGDYAAVDISVEEDGGPPVHSDTSLAGGTFS